VRLVVLGDIITPDVPRSRRHDAGTFLSADAAEIVDVVEQRVDERAGLVARGGMTMPAGLSTTIRSAS
jgi:hypothetical protein